MNDTIKKELTYITGLLGGLVIALGEMLPYLTPDTLAELGVSTTWCKRISIAIGLLLIVYRKNPNQSILPPPSPEADRIPFVKPSPKEIPK